MNIFATIEELDELCFEKVTYYSVIFESKKHNEFEDFILRHEKLTKIEEELADLSAWIEEIGATIGALPNYFRHEQKADALPPPSCFLEIEYIENLRLYCMRVTKNIVFLFNGGIKTKNVDTAQECPIVKKYFDQANQLVNAIDCLIRDKEIIVNHQSHKLEFKPTLEIEI